MVRRVVATAGLIVAMGISPASADEALPTMPAETITKPQTINEPQSNDGKTNPEAERERRQNTVTVGVLILVGVASIGLLLVAAALIWGAKIRRIARQPGPEPTRQDDLWYLRKGSPTEGENIGEAASMERPASEDESRTSDTDDTRS